MEGIPESLYCEWYKNLQVFYLMSKSTFRREVMIYHKDNPYKFRNLRAHNSYQLQYIAKFFSMMSHGRKPYNLYYSLARFKEGIPKRQPLLNQKDENCGELWKGECWKHMEAYDFVVDIDSPSHDDFYMIREGAVSLAKWLKHTKVPFQLRFSGMGFHFVVPYEYFEHLGFSFEPFTENNIYVVFRKIAEQLKDMFSDFIDLKIYEHRRVLKIPYSLAVYPGVILKRQVLVCLPLFSIDELEHFTLEQAHPDYVNLKAHNGLLDFWTWNENGNVNALLELLSDDNGGLE